MVGTRVHWSPFDVHFLFMNHAQTFIFLKTNMKISHLTQAAPCPPARPPAPPSPPPGAAPLEAGLAPLTSRISASSPRREAFPVAARLPPAALWEQGLSLSPVSPAPHQNSAAHSPGNWPNSSTRSYHLAQAEGLSLSL